MGKKADLEELRKEINTYGMDHVYAKYYNMLSYIMDNHKPGKINCSDLIDKIELLKLLLSDQYMKENGWKLVDGEWILIED